MNSDFKVGDLLLYFNNDLIHLVLLDEVDQEYFIVITSIDEDYQYGYKIKIKYLTNKYFIKIDQNLPLTKGHWELYQIDKPLLLSFKNIHIPEIARYELFL